MLDENIKGIEVLFADRKPKENATRQALMRKITALGKKLNTTVFVDCPGPSEFGRAGRPDVYVFIMGHLFMIELKAPGRGLRHSQEQWHSECRPTIVDSNKVFLTTVKNAEEASRYVQTMYEIIQGNNRAT